MRNFLSAMHANIGHHAVSWFNQPFHPGDFAHGAHETGDLFHACLGRKVVPAHIFALGDDERVPRREGVDVEKREDLVVFVDAVTGDLAVDDLRLTRWGAVDEHLSGDFRRTGAG